MAWERCKNVKEDLLPPKEKQRRSRNGTTAKTVEEPADSRWDPPFPSNVSTSGAASNGKMGSGASEGGGKIGATGGVGRGKLKSTLSPHSWKDRVSA